MATSSCWSSVIICLFLVIMTFSVILELCRAAVTLKRYWIIYTGLSNKSLTTIISLFGIFKRFVTFIREKYVVEETFSALFTFASKQHCSTSCLIFSCYVQVTVKHSWLKSFQFHCMIKSRSRQQTTQITLFYIVVSDQGRTQGRWRG